MPNCISAHIRSNVLGYICLFRLLGGTAWAAGLTADSVKSKHIVDGQVKAEDIGSDAAGAQRVDEASLDSAVLRRQT